MFRFTKRKKVPNRDYLIFKEATRRLVKSRLAYYNQFYSFKIGRVAVRNQRSRWGSCSTKGNLNFNYRLIKLPQDLADFIIVHELCHLGEFNHSPRFWGLVTNTIPDAKSLKKKLRQIPITV